MAQFINRPSEYYAYGGNPNIAWPQSVAMTNYIRCVPLDARILTRYGWKTCDDVRPGDETVGYNPLTGKSAWTKVTAVHQYSAVPVVRLFSNRVDLRSTPNHRWLTEKNLQPETFAPYRREMFTETQHIGTRHRIRLAVPHDDHERLPISTIEAELLGWIAGDGCIGYGLNNRGGKRGKLNVTIHQSKPQYVTRIRELLADIPHTEYQQSDVAPPVKRADGKMIQARYARSAWRLRSPYARDLLRRSGYEAGLETMVIAMSSDQREAFIAGLLGADGYLGRNNTWTFCQNDGPVLHAFMLAAYLTGYWCNPVNSAGQKHIHLGSPYVGSGSGFHREDLGFQPVWCVTTELGSWTAEQSRQIFLTGNSGTATRLPPPRTSGALN